VLRHPVGLPAAPTGTWWCPRTVPWPRGACVERFDHLRPKPQHVRMGLKPVLSLQTQGCVNYNHCKLPERRASFRLRSADAVLLSAKRPSAMHSDELTNAGLLVPVLTISRRQYTPFIRTMYTRGHVATFRWVASCGVDPLNGTVVYSRETARNRWWTYGKRWWGLTIWATRASSTQCYRCVPRAPHLRPV